MKTHKLQNLIQHPVLVTDEKMIEYFIGTRFHVSERFIGLLVEKHRVRLFLNDLFPYPNADLEIVRFNDAQDVIKLLASQLDTDTLYVDRQMQAGFLLRLMKAKPLIEVAVDELADRVRAVKDSEEIAKMRKASSLNDEAMAKVKTLLKPGITELEVAMKIEEIFAELKTESVSFRPIVAFADNASDPHGVPGERILKPGDAIIVDMGCKQDGYCSDMTRTFFVGHNSLKEVYETVRKANLAAIATIKPGIPFKQIDHAARSVIEAAGYGDKFIHRTGHGIGQDVHEPYDVSSVSETLTLEGMCFSIEPGIYLPGVGGVRIEDLVVVTKDGCEVLNRFPKDQEVIGI